MRFPKTSAKTIVNWNMIIDRHVKNGRLDRALETFNEMPVKNTVSWNIVISALMHHGRVDSALKLFGELPERNVVSWTTMVSGLAKNGRIHDARTVFDIMPIRNTVSWNAIVSGYVCNQRLVEAICLFERMPQRNLSSWNTMIMGFVHCGDLRKAWKLFEDMPKRNTISWTTLITGCVRHGEHEAALRTFIKMITEGEAAPNEVTFVNVLSACGDLGSLEEGKQLHQMITKKAYGNGAFLVSSLISMYAKCGELVDARRIFDESVKTHIDLGCWNSMIAAYTHHGSGREAIGLFYNMVASGVKPDDTTYISLLSACNHSGLLEEGQRHFIDFLRDETIIKREDHYSCLVDLCCRAGFPRVGYDAIKKLHVRPSIPTWVSLLAGCHAHGDMELGRLVEKEVEGQGVENVGACLLMSNMYAGSRKWNDVADLRLKMKKMSLKKQPGCSWINVQGRVHVFLAGYVHHQASFTISLLLELHVEMRKEISVVIDEYRGN